MKRYRSIALLALACLFLMPSDPVRGFAQIQAGEGVGAISVVSEPMTRQVVQRRDDNRGNILFIGTCSGNVDGFQASSTLQPGMVGIPMLWTPLIDVTIYQGHFIGIFRQPAGGFYNIQIRPTYQGQVGAAVTVSGVGVGEVFITAGQSNTTNSGTPTGFYPSALVSAFNDGSAQGLDPTYPGAYWRWGYDPQPVIDGSAGGSPWPTMANNLAVVLNVPVGIYAAGCGGTAIAEWLPGHIKAPTLFTPQMVLFNRLTNAIQYLTERGGVRAVLWHQGETDYYAQTTEYVYGVDLSYIINQSRAQTGVPVKWMVAQASTPLTDEINDRLSIELAQSSVVDYVLTFPGPNTDFIGLSYRNYLAGDPVHFNASGLITLGGYWGLYVVNVPGFMFNGHLPPPN